MRVYTIPEALGFLAVEYGSGMPTSQETLRRAIRIGDLKVQETGDPGRKGYTIAEEDLRAYAQNRISRTEKRLVSSSIPYSPKSTAYDGAAVQPDTVSEPRHFHEIFRQYRSNELTEAEYSMALLEEKKKWEDQLRRKKDQLIHLNSQLESLKNEIDSYEANIEEFKTGINKTVFE